MYMQTTIMSTILRHPHTPTLFPYTTLFRSLPRPQEDDPHGIGCCAFTPDGRQAIVGTDASELVVLDLLTTEPRPRQVDRKSTRLNSSHITISYAVFCLKKKKPT